MSEISHSGTKWGRVGQLAARQHGVVSRRQLRTLGVGDGSIEKALATGHLHPSYRGTFGVGHLPSHERARMMAAVLACGRGTVVSHLTAAHLLGLRDRVPASVEVIAPGQRGRGLVGVRRHHVHPPLGPERGHCDGIPCTSPSRTVVDLAGMLGERSLRRLMERAAMLEVLDVPAIERSLAAARRRGATVLRAILRDWHAVGSGRTIVPEADTPHLRSDLEARLLALVGGSELPLPACNQKVEVGDEKVEVDFLWAEQQLVVETDGKRFHNNPLAFERDRKRDRALQLSGYSVVRFTHAQIERESEAVTAAIRRLLERDFR